MFRKLASYALAAALLAVPAAAEEPVERAVRSEPVEHEDLDKWMAQVQKALEPAQTPAPEPVERAPRVEPYVDVNPKIPFDFVWSKMRYLRVGGLSSGDRGKWVHAVGVTLGVDLEGSDREKWLYVDSSLRIPQPAEELTAGGGDIYLYALGWNCDESAKSIGIDCSTKDYVFSSMNPTTVAYRRYIDSVFLEGTRWQFFKMAAIKLIAPEKIPTNN